MHLDATRNVAYDKYTDNDIVTLEASMQMTLDKEESPDDLFTPEEAAAYLAQRWGRPSFSVEGLRSLRRRIGLVPAKKGRRTSVYKRSQLDSIEEPEQRGRYVDKE
jgi:hypothetical protein